MITASINHTLVKEKGALSSGQFQLHVSAPVGQQNTGWISPLHAPWERHLCVVFSLHDWGPGGGITHGRKSDLGKPKLMLQGESC